MMCRLGLPEKMLIEKWNSPNCTYCFSSLYLMVDTLPLLSLIGIVKLINT